MTKTNVWRGTDGFISEVSMDKPPEAQFETEEEAVIYCNATNPDLVWVIVYE